ncbi:iron permease [Paramagnetospirillum marisnigri]|uniref:Iron permease n=1 Tax=Paramagnetospirillum marisnigri TaxID=1285242 RepID=A0A178M9K6_9PROT|nr:FTR1 family protein [Paramagnetospirillum marisnigri]OAN44728.1 iron permease [Paramagnetospirillum marisnigri]
MLAATIIVFREVLEAALIIGIVLAATKGVAASRRWVGLGIAIGVLGSALLALGAERLSGAMDGVGQELFNAAILGLAVAMLAWHTAWMQSHARELVAEMTGVGRQVTAGDRPLWVLAVVVGVAVLREGAETVLFVLGTTASATEGPLATLAGCVLGLAAGAAMGSLLYMGLVRIPVRRLIGVTTWLVMLLAAGMAAQAVNFLDAAGWLDLSSQPVWDSSALLQETSLPGRLAHTLIGYVDRPSMAQLLAWVATLGGIHLLSRGVAARTSRTVHG